MPYLKSTHYLIFYYQITDLDLFQLNHFQYSLFIPNLTVQKMDLNNPQAFLENIQRRIRILKAKSDLQMSVEILTSSISLLKDKVLENQEKLKKLSIISQHVINILKQYPTEDKKVNRYILESVTAVKFIVAKLSENKEEKQEESIDKTILVLNKLQDAILDLISSEETTLSDIFNSERKIEEILYYAEDSRFISEALDNTSWKQQINEHRQRLNQSN